jgi:PhnB protein
MAHSFDLFINFDGNCREAADFYSKVFKSEIRDLMTYSDAPPSEGFTVPESDKNKVMYCCIPIFGCNVMFCDNPSDSEFIVGNNISPTIGSDDLAEIRRIFYELKEGGKVDMELQKTFWSSLFGMVTDRYGVIWQLSHFDSNIN